MAKTQDDLNRLLGVNLPDGRRMKNGVLISAEDAARTDATTARNAALSAEAASSAITPSTPIGQPAPAMQPAPALGNTPVGNAVANTLRSAAPTTTAAAPAMPAPAMPGQPAPLSQPPGFNPYTQGIDVNSYVGSRYSKDFAANNPQPQLEPEDVTLARQMLRANAGSAPGRFYDEGNLAKATPTQLRTEAAMLPTYKANAAAASEDAALKESYQFIQNATARPDGAGFTSADAAAALGRYVGAGGKDAKRIEELRQTGEGLVKGSAPAKPMPGSAGYETITLPGGATIVRDNATGQPVAGADILKPADKKSDEKALTATEIQKLTALQQAASDIETIDQRFASYEDPNYGGPIAGRLKSMLSLGTNPRTSEIENLITAATPNLARGVFGEVGVLTDEDVKRYARLLPNVNDTAEQRGNKLRDLRARLKSSMDETIGTLSAAGRDVNGIRERATGSAPAAAPAGITPEAAAAELARRRQAKAQ